MLQPSIFLIFLLVIVNSHPIVEHQQNSIISGNDEPKRNTAFQLAQPEDDVAVKEKPNGFVEVLQGITENTYFKDFMSFMKIIANGADNAAAAQAQQDAPASTPANAKGAVSRVVHTPIALQNDPKNSFESSLSMDDAVQSESSAGAKKSISKEEWASTLFGERGVLTGIFKMMDQQRRAQAEQAQPPTGSVSLPAAAHPAAQHPSASDPSKINGKPLDLDFKKIFDSLVMGAANKGEFGDPGPELPEFLGICNRLSCGDIYKAIDQFRRSDLFSNFQTALTLVQDPNGWETIGKLLSNPELISQFTGGSGMEEVFGSALGQAKKETGKSKEKNTKLTPEDGDFGTEFPDPDGPPKENKPDGKELPEIDFSVDSKPVQPTKEDYYSEVVKNTDTEEPVDYEDLSTKEEEVDVAPPTKGTSTTQQTTRATSTTRGFTTISRERYTTQKPPTLHKTSETITESGFIPPSRPIKSDNEDKDLTGESLPELSFSIDGEPEQEGEVFEKVEVAPPSEKIVNVHSGFVSRTSSGGVKGAGTFVGVPTTLTFVDPNAVRHTSPLSRMRRILVTSPAPEVTVATRVTVTTTPPTTTTTTTRRPTISRRPTTTTTAKPTRNPRKDSDYYAMYYDEQPR